MAIKRICQVGMLYCLFSLLPIYAQENPFGQTLQINTHLRSMIGKPSWLLIVRNVETGQVVPYVFDFTKNDNFWLALTFSRSYRVTVSNLKFGSNVAINNFCHLENGILTAQSMSITLTGVLSPDSRSSHCHVLKYQEFDFPIATSSANEQ